MALFIQAFIPSRLENEFQNRANKKKKIKTKQSDLASFITDLEINLSASD